jgi:hypothetical protein
MASQDARYRVDRALRSPAMGGTAPLGAAAVDATRAAKRGAAFSNEPLPRPWTAVDGFVQRQNTVHALEASAPGGGLAARSRYCQRPATACAGGGARRACNGAWWGVRSPNSPKLRAPTAATADEWGGARPDHRAPASRPQSAAAQKRRLQEEVRRLASGLRSTAGSGVSLQLSCLQDHCNGGVQQDRALSGSHGADPPLSPGHGPRQLQQSGPNSSGGGDGGDAAGHLLLWKDVLLLSEEEVCLTYQQARTAAAAVAAAAQASATAKGGRGWARDDSSRVWGEPVEHQSPSGCGLGGRSSGKLSDRSESMGSFEISSGGGSSGDECGLSGVDAGTPTAEEPAAAFEPPEAPGGTAPSGSEQVLPGRCEAAPASGGVRVAVLLDAGEARLGMCAAAMVEQLLSDAKAVRCQVGLVGGPEAGVGDHKEDALRCVCGVDGKRCTCCSSAAGIAHWTPLISHSPPRTLPTCAAEGPVRVSFGQAPSTSTRAPGSEWQHRRAARAAG